MVGSFDDVYFFVVYKGTFGVVYKATLVNGPSSTSVAVKTPHSKFLINILLLILSSYNLSCM